MLIRLESLLERMRILRAQLADEASRFATVSAWIGQQWTTLLYIVGLAGGAFAIDRALFDQPVATGGPDLQVMLPPTLTAGAAGFVFVMTSWLTITQSTASRFDSAAVVRRLADDWVASFVLRLLAIVVFTAIIGLATPALTGHPAVTGAALPAVLLLIAVPMLLVLRRYALFLTHPGRFAELIENDTRQRILRMSGKDRPSRSVASHYRELVGSDLQVWDGLLAFSASRDPGLHSLIAMRLGLTLASYWNRKVGIEPNSEWFPLREVPSEDRDLRRIHADLGLGQARTRERDGLWLERGVMRVLSSAARRDTPTNQTRADVLEVLKELLVLAWHRQETAALAELRAMWTAERALTRPEEYDAWADAVVNGLMRFADEILKHGLRRSEFLPLKTYPDRHDFMAALPPAEIFTELHRSSDAVENERALTGRIITPLEALSREVDRRLAAREEELIASAVTWLLSELRAAIETLAASTAPASGTAVCDLYGALLTVCNRSYALNSKERAAAALGLAADLSPQVGAVFAKALPDKRRHVLREVTTIALKAIRDNWSEAPAAVRLAVALADHERRLGMTSDGQHLPMWLETWLVLGGLAFAAGEVRSDRGLVDGVVAQLRSIGVSSNHLRKFKESLGGAPMLRLGATFTLEYHQYAVKLYEEAEAKGRRYLRGRGEIGYSEVLDTESEWLMAHSHFIFGVEDAIEGFLEYAGRDDADTSDQAT